jgi:hypothetical protein
MRILDYDSAEFKNFIEVVIYFNMEDKFKEVFGVRAEEYLLEESDGYYENEIISKVLSLVESEPGIILASSYREESKKFEIIRIIYEPVGDVEIDINIKWLEKLRKNK